MNPLSTSKPGLIGGTGVQLGQVNVVERPLGEPGAGLAFPAEDCGQSLADMAMRDLDAALQLLAERAQYITGATGAAIALRHEGESDMMCRASAGPNAPEIGALLSTEFGLSGESVRSRQPLRCDDAKNDERVNRESCRALGIASVAVVPVVGENEVVGVFELFSGQPHAFGERDVAALQRLAEMVETAGRYARAAGACGLAGALDATPWTSTSAGFSVAVGDEKAAHSDERGNSGTEGLENSSAETEAEPSSIEAAPIDSARKSLHKPLLWSANSTKDDPADSKDDPADSSEGGSFPETVDLPLALRGLRKCEACGFPVSEGRKLCLDCDEKNWRGQRRIKRTEGIPAKEATVAVAKVSAPEPASEVMGKHHEEVSPQEIVMDDLPILSSALEPAPSWFAANKYVLGAIVAAVAAIAAVAFLR